jgi:hypothetical protein
MKPIKQTTFGWPHGNCYAACVASVLELPLEDMPLVPADADFNAAWDGWFASRGLTRINFNVAAAGTWRPEGYSILCGINPRGIRNEQGELVHHATVALNGTPLHDPHPDNTFLLEATEIEIIYRLDPAGTAREVAA